MIFSSVYKFVYAYHAEERFGKVKLMQVYHDCVFAYSFQAVDNESRLGYIFSIYRILFGTWGTCVPSAECLSVIDYAMMKTQSPFTNILTFVS